MISNNNANHRDSLRVDTYLPVWFRKVTQSELDRVRSNIIDLSVARRVDAQIDLKEDPLNQNILEKLDGLNRKMDSMLKHIKIKEEHNYSVQPINLSGDGCRLLNVDSHLTFVVDDYVEIRFILPIHRHEEILALGKVLRIDPYVPDKADEEKKVRNWVVASFLEIAPDQSDTIARYLIQRQLEEARLKTK